VPVGPAEAPGLVSGLLGGVTFILSMGMIFDGDVHPTVPPPPAKEYEIVRYKDRAAGFQNHHGVLDIWATYNIPGYTKRAPNSTTIRLSVPHHEAANAALRDWLAEKTGRPVGGVVDWTTISPREILELVERQLDAAATPASARDEYYRQLNVYIHDLK